MELNAVQRQIVEHEGGPVRVFGRAGTGKTTALVQRYLRLATAVRPSEILVICRSRDAVVRFRDAVLPALAGGFDALPIATFGGVAFDVLARAGVHPRRLSFAEQRALVRALLAEEGAEQWPTLHPLLHRAAFVDEVVDALAHWRQRDSAYGTDLDSAWREVAAFAERYQSVLDAEGAVDAVGLLTTAADAVGAESGPYRHVIVDDYEVATAAAHRLLGAVSAHATSTCIAANRDAAVGNADGRSIAFFDSSPGPTIELAEPYRHPAPPELVRCPHPSVEAEAVAGELLAASERGVRWSDMAVLCRRPRQRARAITRALARHGIPATAADAPLSDEPVVRAAVDALRWAAGDETAIERLLSSPLSGLDTAEIRALRRELIGAGDNGDGPATLIEHPRLAPLVALRAQLAARIGIDNPAELLFLVWERALGPLLVASHDPADDRAIDAFVAFHDGVTRDIERNPHMRLGDWLAALPTSSADPWRMMRPTGDTVTVGALGAASGREWHTVIIAGAVEGELPAIRGRQPVFEPAVLDGSRPPTPAERRRRSLADERRLFCEIGCTRATDTLVATAAPEPGVLESRFVEGWPVRGPRLPLAPGTAPVVRPPTDGSAPLFPDGTLKLSASQLETYEDCPLRYFYEYVLRVRGDTNVYAELGTLVHETLAAFLDPAPEEPVEYSAEGLRRLGEGKWRDDLARYRPQIEEARRGFFEMLQKWWDEEGSLKRPDVLAVERHFEVDVGPHRITGSIDRIDRIDGGLRIVDYKTSSRETPNDEMPDNLQLAVYHLAACRDPELAACGPANELDLMFVRSMKIRTQPVTSDHEAATEGRVLAVADRILAEDFEPSVHANCRVCAFHRLCPIQAAGREASPDV